MPTVVTVAERKRQERERMRGAFAALARDLAAHARRHGGRYVVYGSFARGDIRTTSDVDILVDFPDDLCLEAMDAAETVCRRHDLRPDIRPAAWCTDTFVAAVTETGQILE